MCDPLRPPYGRIMFAKDRILLPHTAIWCGVLSLLAVLCFHFPEALTSQEFRPVYTSDFARGLLLVGLVTTFVAGTVAVLADQRRRLALTGLASATAAVLLGGTSVPLDKVEATPYSLGVDWFILSLFFSAVVFIPLERYLAHSPHPVLRGGWRTDICYFFLSHVLVQLILIVVTTSTTTVAAAIAILAILAFIVVPIAIAGSYAVHEVREWIGWAVETNSTGAPTPAAGSGCHARPPRPASRTAVATTITCAATRRRAAGSGRATSTACDIRWMKSIAPSATPTTIISTPPTTWMRRELRRSHPTARTATVDPRARTMKGSPSPAQ